MLAGRDRFRAGLYVGLGSLGIEAATWVLRGSIGGCGGAWAGGGGILRGPCGRPDAVYSDGDGILTLCSDPGVPAEVSTGVDIPRSFANLSARLSAAVVPLEARF